MPTKQPSKVTFGARLTYAMALRGIKVNQLEARANLSRGHASRMRRNKRGTPGWDIADAMASVLGIRTAWLLAGEEPMDRLPHGALAAGSTVVHLVNSAGHYPRDWPGFWKAADGILLDNPNKNTPYYGAVMGFSETLTAETPPVPLTTDTLWKCILRFYDARKDVRASEMARWQAAGEDYHERNKHKRKQSRTATESKAREKRSG